jgi:hypothetical protein
MGVVLPGDFTVRYYFLLHSLHFLPPFLNLKAKVRTKQKHSMRAK